MTSPNILEKGKASLDLGITTNYIGGTSNSEKIDINPSLATRYGLWKHGEVGVTLTGLPAIVIDYKQRLLKIEDFSLSVDIAGYAGLWQGAGMQYDVLLGTESLYFVCGYATAFTDGESFLGIYDYNSFVLGIGSKPKALKGLGFQITYGKANITGHHHGNPSYLSLGLNYNLIREGKPKKKVKKQGDRSIRTSLDSSKPLLNLWKSLW
ncbi:MAG: hypothetical protein HRT72_09840 [Flavobacteriales bacterium]|nr:hypothetical protein [Flavobacteriales bacterium]